MINMSILNVAEIEKSSEKITLYKGQEQINFQNLCNSFKNINDNYNTSNSGLIEEICIDLADKFNTIVKNHESYITVLNKNIEKYIATSKSVEQSFDDIIIEKR